ncbi:hypothetical protein ABZT49_26040 [Methylobacterium sp. EM32]|uniref:hypothetical protein n=1 Tax=Methylobacterium sp. EM32 TaxID=3163481 RepID=UPI0033B432E7
MVSLDVPERAWSAAELETPFAETFVAAEPRGAAGSGFAPSPGFAPWAGGAGPFAEGPDERPQGEDDRQRAAFLSEIRDEDFAEAVALLAEETEQAIADRFTGETAGNALDRERFGEAQLAGLRYEAVRYLEELERGLAGQDLPGLPAEQLEAILDRLEPARGDLTPAGENFLGGIIRKARKAVGFVVNAAKTVATAPLKLLGPVLTRLKALVAPLLKRVLSFAIGRLPAPLRPAARQLAQRLKLEAETGEAEGGPLPAALTDLPALAEEFDEALAEALDADPEAEFAGEMTEAEDAHDWPDGRRLEALAEARGALLDSLAGAGEDEDLAPAIEQFVPVLLGALKLGISVVGRQRVVNFLAKYIAQLIGRWVGPQLSKPLSDAIVDAGLKLVMLEAEGPDGQTSGESGRDPAHAALAGLVEDTVRTFAENEDYIFEDEGLMQLAAAEAFAGAVATHFPPTLVRPALRQAPSLGGAFLGRRLRTPRPVLTYSRVPEVTITSQIADALPAFGGTTLGATLRAAGVSLPITARLHLHQAMVGTSLSRLARRGRGVRGGGALGLAAIQPLTKAAAGLLLREPGLGVDVPAAFLHSRHRIAAGQRVYRIEPLGAAAVQSLAAAPGRTGAPAPSRFAMRLDRARRAITVRYFLSEPQAQGLAQAVRAGGSAALMQALTELMGGLRRHGAACPTCRTGELEAEGFDTEEFAFGPRALRQALRHRLARQVRRWLLPALARWVRDHAEAFLRAAQHPASGVTIRAELTAVPGLSLLDDPRGALTPGQAASAFRGTPSIAIAVVPGRAA